jgi:hypothetical protein
MRKVSVILIALTVFIPGILFSLSCTTLGPVFKKETVPEGKAIVYIYRQKKYMDSGLKYYVVEANGLRVAGLYNGGYFPYITKPGLIEFKSRAEYTNSVKTNIKAGQIYYLRLSVEKGTLVGRPVLKFVQSEVGEKEITTCKLITEK